MSKNKFTEKVDKFYLEELGKLLDRQNKSKRVINEEGLDDEETNNTIVDDEAPEEIEDMNSEEKNPSEEADEILSEVDINSISNEGKLELIAAIIDSAQQTSETDDEFSDFMNAILDKVNEFQYEEESEEAEEDMMSDEETSDDDMVVDEPADEEENV